MTQMSLQMKFKIQAWEDLKIFLIFKHHRLPTNPRVTQYAPQLAGRCQDQRCHISSKNPHIETLHRKRPQDAERPDIAPNSYSVMLRKNAV